MGSQDFLPPAPSVLSAEAKEEGGGTQGFKDAWRWRNQACSRRGGGLEGAPATCSSHFQVFPALLLAILALPHFPVFRNIRFHIIVGVCGLLENSGPDGAEQGRRRVAADVGREFGNQVAEDGSLQPYGLVWDN